MKNNDRLTKQQEALRKIYDLIIPPKVHKFLEDRFIPFDKDSTLSYLHQIKYDKDGLNVIQAMYSVQMVINMDMPDVDNLAVLLNKLDMGFTFGTHWYPVKENEIGVLLCVTKILNCSELIEKEA